MKKILLSAAVVSAIAFTACKNETKQEVSDEIENAQDQVKEQLDELKEQAEDSIESLEAKIKEAQEELAKAETVDAKQAATKKLNEAKAALATLKGEAISTANEVRQKQLKLQIMPLTKPKKLLKKRRKR